MSSEIRLRKSHTPDGELNPEEIESPYCDYLEAMDNNYELVSKIINWFGIIPVIYSLYKGFYIHAAVSGSMSFFDHYPEFLIMDLHASTVAYRAGFFLYLFSQICVINRMNFYIVVPAQIGVQYCFLFHLILDLKNDKRHLFFKGLMNFFICFTKCTILYYLGATQQVA